MDFRLRLRVDVPTLLVAGVLLAGCAGERPGRALAAPDTLIPRFDREWGSLVGESEAAFTRIQAFAPSESGGVFVFDTGRGLQQFAADGSFVQTLARYGEGPGEMRNALLARSGSGLLVVWSYGNDRINVWDRELDFVRSVLPPRPRGAYDESALVILDDGEVWAKLNPGMTDDGLGFPRPGFQRVWPDSGAVIQVGAGGAACDNPHDVTYRNGFWLDMREPWFPSTVTAMGPRGEVYVGCNDEFRFLRILDGDTTVFVRASREQVIPDNERRFFETAWTPPMGTMPRLRPEYTRIIPGGDGRVWVFETLPAVPREMAPEIVALSGFDTVLVNADRGGRFSVFDEAGRLIAIVPLPDDVYYSGLPTTPRVYIRGDTIWAVRTGDFDENYVARYVVPFPPGG